MPRLSSFEQDIPPAGWAEAQVLYDTIRSIDDDFAISRFVVRIKKFPGEQLVYHTDPFVAKKWEDWYPEGPPVPTEDESKIRDSLVNQLHNDGWLDVLDNNGEPTNSLFWRRT